MLSIIRPTEIVATSGNVGVYLALAGICLLVALRYVGRAVAPLSTLLAAVAAATVVAVTVCAALFFLAAALLASAS